MMTSERIEGAKDRAPGATWFLLGALTLAGVIATTLLRTARNQRGARHRVEKLRDDTLRNTFPASDPPASQYFDIPANRQ
jgi:hypothetical protein